MCGKCERFNFGSRFSCYVCRGERDAGTPIVSDVPTACLLLQECPAQWSDPAQVAPSFAGAVMAERLHQATWLVLFSSVEAAVAAKDGIALNPVWPGERWPLVPEFSTVVPRVSDVVVEDQGEPMPQPVVMEAAPVVSRPSTLVEHQRQLQDVVALDQFYQELKKEEPKAAEKPERPVVEGNRCLVCDKRFPSVESLEKHCKLSDQHKRNLAGKAPAVVVAPRPAASATAPPAVRAAGLGLGAEQPAAAAPGLDQHSKYKAHGYKVSLARFQRDEK